MLKNAAFLLFAMATLVGRAQFGFQLSTSIDVVEDGEALKFPWAGGMDYCQFSNIDLDFDGVNDLFVFDRTCNKVLTFLQKGGVGEVDFEYAPEYENIFPDDLHDWALLADYNRDGKPDIYTYEIGGGRVFMNVGTAETGHNFVLVNPLLATHVFDVDTYMFLDEADIPAIVDVDGDSDLDILAFGILGTTVEYHKCMSMELYGIPDSLVFETKSICWGRFREAAVTNVVTLWDTLEYPCKSSDFDAPEFPFELTDAFDRDIVRHSGSTVLALDMDDSGVMDLILGDISYPNLVMLLNSGSEVNANSGMVFQDTLFPSSSVPVNLPVFPAAFHVDISNDGIRDLLVSPNSKFGSENALSVWSYLNEAEDLSPDFVYQQSDFLQEDMIENGTSSLPVYFDHNGDGLLDLLVSSQGRYNPEINRLHSKIAYYQNVGTADVPAFELMTDDYQDLSEKGIGDSLAFYPTFGDLDGDGDEDMILGEYIGYCYYFENTGGAGNPAVFDEFTILNNSEGAAIIQGTYCYPQLVDLDRDGDEDLVIGRRTGKLQYLENTGIGTYNFVQKSNELGLVDVAGEGFIQGHAVPQFVEVDGEYHLIVGSKRGDLFYYDGIEDNIDGAFHLVDLHLDNVHIGTFAAPAIANLDGDNRFEMVLGNRRGGVTLFESATTDLIGIENLVHERGILIYPNPANQQVTVNLGSISATDLKQTKIILFTLTGEHVQTIQLHSNQVTINVQDFSKGTYLIQVIDEKQTVQKKLIIQ